MCSPPHPMALVRTAVRTAGAVFESAWQQSITLPGSVSFPEQLRPLPDCPFFFAKGADYFLGVFLGVRKFLPLTSSTQKQTDKRQMP